MFLGHSCRQIFKYFFFFSFNTLRDFDRFFDVLKKYIIAQILNGINRISPIKKKKKTLFNIYSVISCLLRDFMFKDIELENPCTVH